MKNLLSLLIALAVTAGFSLAQDKDKKADKEAKAGKEAKADVVEIKLGIDAANPMMYDKKTLEVPAGKKIRLTFENTGPLPKVAAGHNVVIMKKGEDLTALATAIGVVTMQAAQGVVKDYLTADQKKQVIAYSKVLGPKDKDVLEFTAPEAGEYEFGCTFIGHIAMMKGKLIVK